MIQGRRYRVTMSCQDRMGIVAAVSTFIGAQKGWIIEASHHADPKEGWFYCVEIDPSDRHCAFRRVNAMLEEHQAETVALARYVSECAARSRRHVCRHRCWRERFAAEVAQVRVVGQVC